MTIALAGRIASRTINNANDSLQHSHNVRQIGLLHRLLAGRALTPHGVEVCVKLAISPAQAADFGWLDDATQKKGSLMCYAASKMIAGSRGTDP